MEEIFYMKYIVKYIRKVRQAAEPQIDQLTVQYSELANTVADIADKDSGLILLSVESEKL